MDAGMRWEITSWVWFRALKVWTLFWLKMNLVNQRNEFLKGIGADLILVQSFVLLIVMSKHSKFHQIRKIR